MKQSFIIDVRSPQEFASGHLDGAVNIPLEQIQQGIDLLEGLEKTSQIMVYCRSGARSAVARSILLQQGYDQVINGGSITTLQMNFKSAANTPNV